MEGLSDSVFCISVDPQFNIIDVPLAGLHFLGYSDIKELELQNINVLIPMPSAALHAMIFGELQKTYRDKERFNSIVGIARSEMNQIELNHGTKMAEIMAVLRSPTAIKKVLNKGGEQKRASVYVDMKSDRFVDVYMLPIRDDDVAVHALESRSSLPIDHIVKDESDYHLKGHVEFRGTGAVPALVAALRTIRDL